MRLRVVASLAVIVAAAACADDCGNCFHDGDDAADHRTLLDADDERRRRHLPRSRAAHHGSGHGRLRRRRSGTLTDPRGWQQAGFEFRFDEAAAPYVVVLAEADEVDALCFPYETRGLYSCQNGPVVALNADRWRTATPEWTGDVATYRQMLVNHEVGHLIGRHHPPEPQCPEPGRPALVMAQQSTELNGCLPNPWPLPEEIAVAALHDEPLAPPYEG